MGGHSKSNCKHLHFMVWERTLEVNIKKQKVNEKTFREYFYANLMKRWFTIFFIWKEICIKARGNNLHYFANVIFKICEMRYPLYRGSYLSWLTSKTFDKNYVFKSLFHNTNIYSTRIYNYSSLVLSWVIFSSVASFVFSFCFLLKASICLWFNSTLLSMVSLVARVFFVFTSSVPFDFSSTSRVLSILGRDLILLTEDSTVDCWIGLFFTVDLGGLLVEVLVDFVFSFFFDFGVTLASWVGMLEDSWVFSVNFRSFSSSTDLLFDFLDLFFFLLRDFCFFDFCTSASGTVFIGTFLLRLNKNASWKSYSIL